MALTTQFIRAPAIAFRLGDFPTLIVKQPRSLYGRRSCLANRVQARENSGYRNARGHPAELFQSQPLVAMLVDVAILAPRVVATSHVHLDGFRARPGVRPRGLWPPPNDCTPHVGVGPREKVGVLGESYSFHCDVTWVLTLQWLIHRPSRME